MERLREIIESAGVDQWGVCPFSEVFPLLAVRSKSRIPENAQNVIVLLFGYYTEEYPNRNLSRYAIVDDYHNVIHDILDGLVENLLKWFKTYQFVPFVDSSPIREVHAAELAGLGEVGMNGQLLNKVYGSYCFIAEIVTDMPLEIIRQKRPNLCIKCGACLRACPTGALSEDGFHKEICRSHITQKKGDLTDWEIDQIRQGGFVWGCDRCTDACPVNKQAAPTKVRAFWEDNISTLGEDNVENLCTTKAYGWRGSKVLLRNLKILRGKKEETVLY